MPEDSERDFSTLCLLSEGEARCSEPDFSVLNLVSKSNAQMRQHRETCAQCRRALSVTSRRCAYSARERRDCVNAKKSRSVPEDSERDFLTLCLLSESETHLRQH